MTRHELVVHFVGGGKRTLGFAFNHTEEHIKQMARHLEDADEVVRVEVYHHSLPEIEQMLAEKYQGSKL